MKTATVHEIFADSRQALAEAKSEISTGFNELRTDIEQINKLVLQMANGEREITEDDGEPS